MPRMASAYAFGFGLGLRGPSTLLFHVSTIVLAVALATRAYRATSDARIRAAVVIAASLAVTPYLYDYDLAATTVVAALLAASFEGARFPMVAVLLAGLSATQAVGYVTWVAGGTSSLVYPCLFAIAVAAFASVPLRGRASPLAVLDRDGLHLPVGPSSPSDPSGRLRPQTPEGWRDP